VAKLLPRPLKLAGARRVGHSTVAGGHTSESEESRGKKNGKKKVTNKVQVW